MNIGIAGGQCAGKTTLATMFNDHALVKFAQPLYSINAVLHQRKNRGFMQEMSDVVKKHFGRDAFIKLFEQNIKELERAGYEKLVCDDVRFELEARYLKDKGWLLVYIDAEEDIRRERAAFLDLDFITGHSSEQELVKVKEICDFTVSNNGTISQLKQIKEVIE